MLSKFSYCFLRFYSIFSRMMSLVSSVILSMISWLIYSCYKLFLYSMYLLSNSSLKVSYDAYLLIKFSIHLFTYSDYFQNFKSSSVLSIQSELNFYLNLLSFVDQFCLEVQKNIYTGSNQFEYFDEDLPFVCNFLKEIFTFLALTNLFKGESIVFFSGFVCSAVYEEDSVYY